MFTLQTTKIQTYAQQHLHIYPDWKLLRLIITVALLTGPIGHYSYTKLFTAICDLLEILCSIVCHYFLIDTVLIPFFKIHIGQSWFRNQVFGTFRNNCHYLYATNSGKCTILTKQHIYTQGRWEGEGWVGDSRSEVTMSCGWFSPPGSNDGVDCADFFKIKNKSILAF